MLRAPTGRADLGATTTMLPGKEMLAVLWAGAFLRGPPDESDFAVQGEMMKPLLPSTAFFGAIAIAAVMTFTSMVFVGEIVGSQVGPSPPEWLRFTAQIGAFLLFLIIAFSLTPLMLRGCLTLAASAGILRVAAPAGWRGVADGATILFWLVYLAGLLVAIPAISRNLF